MYKRVKIGIYKSKLCLIKAGAVRCKPFLKNNYVEKNKAELSNN